MNDVFDGTSSLLANLARIRRFQRKELLLVVSALHCPGCEILDQQWRRTGVRRLLAGRTYVDRIVVGDLYDDPPRKIRFGRWTWELAGFPTVLAFRVIDEGLQLLSVAMGPLDESDPEGTVADLLECRSWVVPDARALRLLVCTDSVCLPLDASNKWRVPLTMSF